MHNATLALLDLARVVVRIVSHDLQKSVTRITWLKALGCPIVAHAAGFSVTWPTGSAAEYSAPPFRVH